MPIKFKNLPTTQPGHNSFRTAQSAVRDILKLPQEATVSVTMSETTVTMGGVKLTLPIGIASVKENTPQLAASVEKVQAMLGGVVTKLSDPGVQPSVDASSLTDEEWVIHVAKEFFPGVIPLHTAKDLYQQVFGTSASSVYRAAFLGPVLRGAVRFKQKTVSFRFTTNENLRPEGMIRDTLLSLGLEDTGEDRMTCHAPLSGPYSDDTAGEYRALFGAFYGALRPYLTSNFPDLNKLK